MNSFLKDDTQFFKEYSDNESFRQFVREKVFELTYEPPVPA
jgi:type I restriction enzyme R subunit